MYLRTTVLLAALPLLAGLAWPGCAEPSAEAEDPLAPPPPPQRVEAQRTYDYTHSVQQKSKSRLTRKLVVALVRFAEDRGIDDVPFGSESEPSPGAGATEIKVDVQVDGARPVESERQPLGMSHRAREILKHELLESESFVLVERERILDILREQRFGETRYVNPETSAEAGEVMSVQYLIEGSMGPNEDRTLKDTLPTPPSYLDGEPSLAERIFNPGKAAQRRRLKELNQLRRRQLIERKMRAENCMGVYLSLYDVRTSEIAVEAFGIGGNRLEAIRDGVEDLVDKCRDIPNPVLIAAVEGDRVYLDIGMEDHISVGQKLRYLTTGPVIRNAAGQVIGAQEEEGGELEVIRVDPLMSLAKVTLRVVDPVIGARVEPLD